MASTCNQSAARQPSKACRSAVDRAILFHHTEKKETQRVRKVLFLNMMAKTSYECDVTQTSPDELSVIDIRSL